MSEVDFSAEPERYAPVDVELFMKLGAPPEAFSATEDGRWYRLDPDVLMRAGLTTSRGSWQPPS
ncbi:MAG TPA: hypothetical protein VF076_06210 [Acidimicrobiales bacterium]